MRIFNLLQTNFWQMTSAIKNYLAGVLPNYNTNYGNNTIFGQIINVLSSSVQNIMLYIEDALVEQNKFTAQRKKSIYGLAALTGYNPNLGHAASMDLQIEFTPNNDNDINVFIKNHETLTCTQNGLSYNIILPQEMIIMDVKNPFNKIVQVVQGKFETQTFISTGGQYYTQNFQFLGNLDENYLKVKVNNEEWEKVDSLYDMDSDGKQWTYKVSPTSGVDIIFGNNQFGRALKVDDMIEISYLVHDGELGNLDINKTTYFVFDNNLRNINGEEIDGNHMFKITFANNESVTSGSNNETIEQVRQMIGLNSRSLVLADVKNYKNFISKFSFCGYNRTWSVPGTMMVNSLVVKNYKMLIKEHKDYFLLTENDFKLSDLQKQSIKNCLKNTGNQLVGVSYDIIDPEICKYALYIYLKPKSINYEKKYINNQIKNLLGNFFSNVNSDSFIPKSDIIQLIKNNIEEIDGVDIYILSERNERALIDREYTDYIYKQNPVTKLKERKQISVKLMPGDNPNLGLDAHGNISIDIDEQFPAIMGGWEFISDVDGSKITIDDPVIIIYE